MLETIRIGSDKYDSASANGWYVMDGDLAVAGPYLDKRVADRHLDEIITKRSK